jgi:acetate kinase
MGFTPLDGLVMATRSGSVDPGLLLWLEEHEHMPPAELAEALETRSGLAGLAGTDEWEISAPDARVRTFVIAAREDRQIADEVRSVLGKRWRWLRGPP